MKNRKIKLGLVATIALYLIFVVPSNIHQQEANLLQENPKLLLSRALINQDDRAMDILEKIEGGTSLTETKNIEELRLEKTNWGIIISLSATTKGNSLHNYYAFAATEQSKIQKIYWSPEITAEITALGDEKWQVKNTSMIPWNIQDNWENYTNFESIKIKSKQKYIAPHETAIFESKVSDEFFPINLKHNYLLIVEN